MICIYSQTNTDYDKNGDAVLNPISCTLTMSINGAWQLNLEHPYDSEGKYKIIKEGAVLRIDLECISELSTVRQLFRIYNYSKGMHSVTAIAFPVAMESTYDAPVDNLVIDSMTGAQVFAELQEYTDKYTLYTDVSETKSASYSNTNINEIIASGGDTSFIKLWGGEILYDNLNYKVLTSLGDSTADFRIKYGRNLMGITYQVDDSGLITRLYPISADNIRLDDEYVQSDNAGLYPVIHSQFVNVPYLLIEDDATSPSRTAKQTRTSMSAISTSANTTSLSAYETALDGGYQPDYIKSIRASIISAVITQALNGVVSTDLYDLASKTITSAMSWMGDLEQPEWEWQGSYEDGWWYGDSDGYAKNQYMRIGKKWSYFGAEGYWEEPKDDTSDWDWHQPAGSTGKRFGNFNKYFAHNEFVYITMDGTLMSYWFNEEGWYEADESGESDWTWHGSGTSEDPYWFGEESASADEENKYAHSTWLFIDGALYFFDEYGYFTPDSQISDYQWDWVQVDERWWFGNAENHEYAATYLVSQWEKINGSWYYFDANGYVVAENTSKANAIAVFTSGMSALTTVCSAQKTILYELLYDLMEEYCGKLFDQGIDYPMVSVTADMVDLSQTVDYAEFSDLEKVNLGDSVEVVDDEHNISYSNRVVGITYDCIRKYNSVVTLGTAVASVQQIVGNANGTPAVSSGIDTSAITTQIGNMVKDVRLHEVSLVNNGIASLDDVITEVEGNPSGTATVDLTKLRVDDVIYQLAEGGGLEYWTEAETKIYQDDYVATTGNLNYLKDEELIIGSYNSNMSQALCIKISKPVGAMVIGWAGNNSFYPYKLITFACTNQSDADFEWGWASGLNTDVSEWHEKESYPLINVEDQFGYSTASYEDSNGLTWYIVMVDTTSQGQLESILIGDSLTRYGGQTGYSGTALQNGTLLVGEADIVPGSGNITQFGNDNYLVRYMSNYDETYITTEGDALFREITTSNGTLTNQMAEKQDVLTAGSHIQISNNTISATYSDFSGTDGTDDGTNGLVPAPTASDADKYLKSDGTWSTVSSSGSDVTITPSLPRGTKIADYTIDTVAGELLAPVVEISQDDYDALPSSKTSDGIVYFITSDKELDSNYSYYTYGSNDEIVVRVYHEDEDDEEIVWFFHGFTQASGLQPIPSALLPYYKLTTVQSAKSYLTGTSSIDGWVAVSIYQGNYVIGLYNTSYGQYSTNSIDAVIVMGNGAEQNTTYYDPYVYITSTEKRSIYLNGNEYTNKTVDYSTTEQTIGTWINGETLYQKTVTTGGSVPTGATLIERVTQTDYDTIKYIKD